MQGNELHESAVTDEVATSDSIVFGFSRDCLVPDGHF